MPTPIQIIPRDVYSVFDDDANDNDKSWTAPTNEFWAILWAQAILDSAAGAGNRKMTLQVQDADGNSLFLVCAGTTQPINKTYTYCFAPGVAREGSFTQNQILIPIPAAGFYVPPGGALRIYDSADISATDDLTVSFQAQRFQIDSPYSTS